MTSKRRGVTTGTDPEPNPQVNGSFLPPLQVTGPPTQPLKVETRVRTPLGLPAKRPDQRASDGEESRFVAVPHFSAGGRLHLNKRPHQRLVRADAFIDSLASRARIFRFARPNEDRWRELLVRQLERTEVNGSELDELVRLSGSLNGRACGWPSRISANASSRSGLDSLHRRCTARPGGTRAPQSRPPLGSRGTRRACWRAAAGRAPRW
jgi:hypothetical protein